MSKENTFELKDLSQGQLNGESELHDSGSGNDVTVAVDHAFGDDGVMSAWAWTSAILLFAVASVFTIFPRFLLFIGTTTSGDEQRTALTPLESFVALHTGILLYAISAVLVLSIPSTAPVQQIQRGVPFHPLLAPLSLSSAVSAFLAYNTSDVGPLSFMIFIVDSVIATFGLWAMSFAGSSSRSKKTGADKRTSRFLFGNKAAASSVKKQWRKEHGLH